MGPSNCRQQPSEAVYKLFSECYEAFLLREQVTGSLYFPGVVER